MKPIFCMFVAAIALAASAGVARADPFTFTAADTPISGSEATTLISTISVAASGTIEDLNVFVNYTSSFTGDVTLTLTHVNTGTSVVLFNRHGGNGDNIANVTFDDEAATPISAGTPPFGPGSFRPFANLTAFDGQTTFGTWTLTAVDSTNDGTGHSIQAFQLSGTATGIATPEPGTWALFGLGAAGLAAAARRRRKLAKPA